MPVLGRGSLVAAEAEAVLVGGEIDQFLRDLLPARDQRIVDPEALARLEQGEAAPLEQGQVEVAVLPDAGLRRIGRRQMELAVGALLDHVEVEVDGAAKQRDRASRAASRRPSSSGIGSSSCSGPRGGCRPRS